MSSAIWKKDLTSLPRWKASLLRGLRIAHLVARDVYEGQLTLHAMGLVYTTLLSLVPLLAVSFSVLKAFGVHNMVEPFLLQFLEPLGQRGDEITQRIIEFVDNTQAGILGTLGFAFLIYTVISLVQKIEQTFNFIWHIRHDRPFTQRFSDYLSVIIIGPVLVFTAVGITASVAATPTVQWLITFGPLARIVQAVTFLLPYILISTAFTLIYIFLPNTRVHFRAALVGGLAAGLLWEAVGWLFASFIVTSYRYTAIYSAFATLILFLIWLHLAWLILLIGSSVAFYFQHPEYLILQRGELRLSNRIKEKLAFLVLAAIGRQYEHGGRVLKLDDLAMYSRVPADHVDRLLELLVAHGLLARTDADPPGYLPARPPENVALSEILELVRTNEDGPQFHAERLPRDETIDQLFEQLEQARADRMNDRTLKDLATADQPVAMKKDSA